MRTSLDAATVLISGLRNRVGELTWSLANAQQLVDLLNARWAKPQLVSARLLELERPPLTPRQRISRWWREL